MRTRDFIWAAIVAIGLGLGMNVGAQTPVLEITGGQVRGVETATAGVDLYKGIPYAAPPVGDLRWKAPQPVVPWMGILEADKFGGGRSDAK